MICHVDACVLCVGSSGIPEGERLPVAYPPKSVGYVVASKGVSVSVYMVGSGYTLTMDSEDVQQFDPLRTGDDYSHKICNKCHVLKPVTAFEKNQRSMTGRVRRRPTCLICRRDIDKREMAAKDKREAEKHRPHKGSLFTCPICRKRSIVGVTARVVLDHHKGIGQPRSFICDSCNTGLGRFQNGSNLLHNALLYIESHGE